ncbi:DUF1127 domain-containing protein [Rhodobacter sp. KR11]|uniref:DUF1127 domain-containing protein n=1 Tax=Rhodobacter sp. KR11 TaxID=2974588 RepID=UPI002222BC3E|nr:DUF1127 domain-containing protein [Rhodobacter sp. KR11]MCW1919525.1 DUF1127 domain-containing protein [Rhodobacter sp. KR11]
MTSAAIAFQSSHPLPAFSRALVAVTVTLVTWQLRRRTRADLRALPDHMLRDIGMTPQDAAAEAQKPFWRP